jgi:YfiR/HmsC-like
MALLRLGRRARAAAVAFALGAVPAHSPAAAPTREYEIKAAFLYNFTRFVAWPARAFSGPDAPLAIGVLGDDPFGPALEATIRGEVVRRHPLVVRRSGRIGDLVGCQLIFVSRSESGRLGPIFAALDHRPALTVSDIAGFASRGGVICFYLKGDRVRFMINPAAADRAGLKISSQLLSLGTIVGPEALDGNIDHELAAASPD